MQIITDTREQDPLIFSSIEGVSVITATMSVGDYGCKHKDGSMDSTVIERKSIGDLYHSFTHEYDNEKAKILRAKAAGLTYILAIESPALDVRKGHQYWKGGELHEVKKSGIAQVRQIMTISRKYDVPVWWCAGRIEMAFLVQEYFLAAERIKADKKKEPVCLTTP